MGLNRFIVGRFFVRREVWVPTPKVWLALLVVTLLGIWLAAIKVYPFLAVTKRENGKYLVVEGWIPAYAMEEASRQFKASSYKAILSSGTFSGRSISIDRVQTDAQHGSVVLRRLGIDSNSIVVVNSRSAWNRTYQAAITVSEWLAANDPSTEAVDVLTLGPHARRSRLLFEKAAQGKLRIGIIAAVDRLYDPKHWWTTSEGVREVLGESVAYAYARLFFWP